MYFNGLMSYYFYIVCVADGSRDDRAADNNSNQDSDAVTDQGASDSSQEPPVECCNLHVGVWIIIWFVAETCFILVFSGTWLVIADRKNDSAGRQESMSTENFTLTLNATSDTSVKDCMIGVDCFWTALQFSAETQLSITITSGIRILSAECRRYGFVVLLQSMLGKILYTLLMGLVFDALWCNQAQPKLIKQIKQAVNPNGETVFNKVDAVFDKAKRTETAQTELNDKIKDTLKIINDKYEDMKMKIAANHGFLVAIKVQNVNTHAKQKVLAQTTRELVKGDLTKTECAFKFALAQTERTLTDKLERQPSNENEITNDIDEIKTKLNSLTQLIKEQQSVSLMTKPVETIVHDAEASEVVLDEDP